MEGMVPEKGADTKAQRDFALGRILPRCDLAWPRGKIMTTSVNSMANGHLDMLVWPKMGRHPKANFELFVGELVYVYTVHVLLFKHTYLVLVVGESGTCKITGSS